MLLLLQLILSRCIPCPLSCVRALNAKWFTVSWQLSAAFDGYKGSQLPSRCSAIPSTSSFLLPHLFVKTCSMPAGMVPQCLSHAGNSTNPSPRVAWPRPHSLPRPRPGTCPLLVQLDARYRGLDVEV